MLLNTNYYLPAELTGYVRAALADQPQNQVSLARWLPNRDVPDLEYRFDKGAGGLTDAATYRAFDTESPIGSRPGLTRVTGELPPISRKIRLGEYDRLRQRANPNPSVRRALQTDGERMTRQIAARVELARSDALVNGTVTISENGVQASVDFGRAAGHAVVAGVLWSALTTADPLADLLSWTQTYADDNGEDPGAIVVRKDVISYMLRNTALRTLLATTLGTPTILNRTQLRDLLSAHNLPPIYEVNTKFNVNGVATPTVPANVVLLLPEPVDPNDERGTQLGGTLWGTTAESLDPKYNLAEADQPGIVAGVYDEEDPVCLWTKAAAISLPVLANPDLSFKARVAA